MMDLMPRKKYIGKVIEWDARAQEGILVTSWGLQVSISGHEILRTFYTSDKTALFYVIFRKHTAFTLLQGRAA